MNFGVKIPFVENLGFVLEKFEDGNSQISFDPRAEHLNSFGVTHGGADMFTYTVRITANGKSKSVRFDDGSMPEPMQKILLAVQTTLFAARR